jgi:hypothetical protein
VSWIHGSRLVASIGAAIVLFCPSAAADPGSPSYQQGKQSIDDAVHQYNVQLTPSTDLHQYCETLLRSDLKSGQIARVDVPSDYVAGCQDEGRALLASH